MGTVYGSQCPIVKGPASIQYDIKLSPLLPPALGDASFHLTAKDQKGTDIACVQAKLAINLQRSRKRCSCGQHCTTDHRVSSVNSEHASVEIPPALHVFFFYDCLSFAFCLAFAFCSVSIRWRFCP